MRREQAHGLQFNDHFDDRNACASIAAQSQRS